jgi:hypothetical protein
MKRSARPPRWLGRTTIVAATIVTFLLGIVGPAQAHYVYAKGLVYGSSTDCTGSRSEISHGNGGGYAKTDTDALYLFIEPITGRQFHCIGLWSRPGGYIASGISIWRYSGLKRVWYVCRDSGYHYNTRSVYQYTLYWYLNAGAWCGNGHFGNMASSWAYNGQWHGGNLWSGYHLLPALDSPPQPPWVRSDGTVDPSLLPDNVPVAGPDGEPLVDQQGNLVKKPFQKSPPGPPNTMPMPTDGTTTFSTFDDPTTGETYTAETRALSGGGGPVS